MRKYNRSEKAAQRFDLSYLRQYRLFNVFLPMPMMTVLRMIMIVISLLIPKRMGVFVLMISAITLLVKQHTKPQYHHSLLLVNHSSLEKPQTATEDVPQELDGVL